MSSAVAPRPPGWRMREDEGQGSLFGGEAFAPAARSPFPRTDRPGTPPREREAAPQREREAAPPREREAGALPEREAVPPRDRDGEGVAPRELTAPPRDVVPQQDIASPRDLAVPDVIVPEGDAAGEEIRVSRALAGPTLDDAVSRAWEGLVAGVPAACPVCHGEIEPALGAGLQGHCGICDITLD